MCYETFQNYLCYNCGFGRSRAGCGILCRWNRAPLAVICLHYGNLGRTFGKCSRLGYSTDFGREAQKVKRMNDFAPFCSDAGGGVCADAATRGAKPRAVRRRRTKGILQKMPWLPQGGSSVLRLNFATDGAIIQPLPMGEVSRTA